MKTSIENTKSHSTTWVCFGLLSPNRKAPSMYLRWSAPTKEQEGASEQIIQKSNKNIELALTVSIATSCLRHSLLLQDYSTVPSSSSIRLADNLKSETTLLNRIRFMQSPTILPPSSGPRPSFGLLYNGHHMIRPTTFLRFFPDPGFSPGGPSFLSPKLLNQFFCRIGTNGNFRGDHKIQLNC